jgi:hypothetical protein
MIKGRVYAHCLKENGVIDKFQEMGYLKMLAEGEGYDLKTFTNQINNTKEFMEAAFELETKSGGCLNIAETKSDLQSRGMAYQEFLSSKGLHQKADEESRITDIALCTQGREFNQAYGKPYIQYFNELLPARNPNISKPQIDEIIAKTESTMKQLCPYVW